MENSAQVERYIDRLVEAICLRGYIIEPNPDLGRWRDCMAAAPGTAAVNPCFDPAHHHFQDDGKQYWLRVATKPRKDGPVPETVAIIAFRLLEVGEGGWIDWLETGRLFSSRLRPLARAKLLHPAEMNWKGRIGHHGGLWVEPTRHRGSGLAYLLTHLVRAISLRDYDVDHHVGVVLEELCQGGLPTKPSGYGYPRAVPSLDGYIMGAARHAKLYSTHISRAEMLAQIDAGPLPERLAWPPPASQRQAA